MSRSYIESIANVYSQRLLCAVIENDSVPSHGNLLYALLF